MKYHCPVPKNPHTVEDFLEEKSRLEAEMPRWETHEEGAPSNEPFKESILAHQCAQLEVIQSALVAILNVLTINSTNIIPEVQGKEEIQAEEAFIEAQARAFQSSQATYPGKELA